MAPPLLFDLSSCDLKTVQYPVDAIEQYNPHRGHMRLLDGVYFVDIEVATSVAYKDIRDDEFWVAGHIPGRPLYPGVLMLESAAQHCSFMIQQRQQYDGFIGLTAFDDVKFRGTVVPGNRLLLLGKEIKSNRRRFTCATQGVVDGNLVFEANITGMVV
jgi:3-hydroxyacyl-[acyl-carrier-protein] dehydratase